MIDAKNIRKVIAYVDKKEKLVSYSELVEEDIYDGSICDLVEYASDVRTELNCILTKENYMFFANFIVDILQDNFTADSYELSIKRKSTKNKDPKEERESSSDIEEKPDYYYKYVKPYYDMYNQELKD